MIKGIHIIPEDTNVPFVKFRTVAFVFSALLMLGSLGLIFTQGLNFGIDFRGGIMLEVQTDGPADLGALREAVGALDLGDATIQEFGQPDQVLVRLPLQEGGPEVQTAAIDSLRGALDPYVIDYRRTEFVGPQVGQELIRAGILAVSLSLLGIMLYVWFRFEWQFGVAALIALGHDVLATLGLFALTQMEFNLSTVAAALMIAGYSINDTVVVFDRVREKLRKYKSYELPAIFNLAINKTLSRTIITSGTTLLALIALWSFGGEVIRSFVVALIWGVVIGTYSSIFIAAPLLILFGVKRGDGGEKQKSEAELRREKAEIIAPSSS